jgi:hypothetical protein
MPDAFELLGRIRQTFVFQLDDDSMLFGVHVKFELLRHFTIQEQSTSPRSMLLKQIQKSSLPLQMALSLLRAILDPLKGPFPVAVAAHLGLQKVAPFSYYNISTLIC